MKILASASADVHCAFAARCRRARRSGASDGRRMVANA